MRWAPAVAANDAAAARSRDDDGADLMVPAGDPFAHAALAFPAARLACPRADEVMLDQTVVPALPKLRRALARRAALLLEDGIRRIGALHEHTFAHEPDGTSAPPGTRTRTAGLKARNSDQLS